MFTLKLGMKKTSIQAPRAPNNALNCRSLRSLDSQKLRFCLLVSLIVSTPINLQVCR